MIVGWKLIILNIMLTQYLNKDIQVEQMRGLSGIIPITHLLLDVGIPEREGIANIS